MYSDYYRQFYPTLKNNFVTQATKSGVALSLILFSNSLFAIEARVLIQNEQQAPMENVVVVIEPQGIDLLASDGKFAQVDQVNREFVPHVQLVQTNTEVSFPNFDDIRHHVYSFSEAKRFELPLYKGTPSEPVLFDQSGIVTLACNIHDHMLGYLYVTDSPWHALTDASGLVSINLPEAEQYIVRAWYPGLGADNLGYEELVSVDQLGRVSINLEQQAAAVSGNRRQLRRNIRYP